MNLNSKVIFKILLMLMNFPVIGQNTTQRTSGEIHESIKKLNFLGSVLYVAAHPDDENTAMISYFSNYIKARTAYLSITRGDGGQNLIGSELREGLGVIRTQELLRAREIDKSSQFFTRANDFGFSKNPDDTFSIWDKDQVLSDVVWVIRNFQPDLIINRFDARTPGTTHGHHTASAQLSIEAFDLSSERQAYPKQLEKVKLWSPKRLFLNANDLIFENNDHFAKVNKSNIVTLDLGKYYTRLGESNQEISARARSMHKSQGFGSTAIRGEDLQYLELLKGKKPSNSDVFEGINTTWTRVKNGAAIGKLISKIDSKFDPDKPEKSLPDLIKAYTMIESLDDGYWKEVKLEEIKSIISDCTGLYMEGIAKQPYLALGSELSVDFEITPRLNALIDLKRIAIPSINRDSVYDKKLYANESFKDNWKFNLPENLQQTNAYWLNKESTKEGMYVVENQDYIGLPETPRELKVRFDFEIQGVPISFTRPIFHKYNDPVRGEVYSPFEITPPVFVEIEKPVYIFTDQSAKSIRVKVRANRENISGKLSLNIFKQWHVEPDSYNIDLNKKGEEKFFTFKLKPPSSANVEEFYPLLEMNGKSYTSSLQEIDYPHIPKQLLVIDKKTKALKLDIDTKGNKIAYIMGSGDNVPESLEEIGYHVTLLNVEELDVSKLKSYDAVILGIRAYNTLPSLENKMKNLFTYVEQGGTMIVQYNRTFELKVEDLAPYELTLSRDRVTDQNSKVSFLIPEHPVLNIPNKITEKDFQGWVQERGLYFPNKWDSHFQAILSCHDKGETPKEGGLLVAKYGEGYFVYTSYSWFRQLPSGVPGAFRIFANMISLGNK